MNAENWYDGEVTNVKFDQVETSLDFFARIVDRSGFWIDDLKQSGRLSVLSSKALGFTKSQFTRNRSIAESGVYIRSRDRLDLCQPGRNDSRGYIQIVRFVFGIARNR